MPPELLADIAVKTGTMAIEPVFTYRVPARLHSAVRSGQLVWVPFRRQQLQGIVLDLYASEADETMPPALRPDPDAPHEASGPTIRDMSDIADPAAALTHTQIRLARWLSDHYRTPLYESLALMLPPGVSQESEPTWRASTAGMSIDLGTLPERERAVLYFLRQRGELTERDLRRTLRGSDGDLRDTYAALQERGLLIRDSARSRPRARPRIEQLVRLAVPPAELAGQIASLAQAPRQQAVMTFLAEQAVALGSVEGRTTFDYPLTALYAVTNANRQIIRALEERALLTLHSHEVRRDPLAGDTVVPDIPPALTPAQEHVWQPIAAALDQIGKAEQPGPPAGAAFLLHGVTGSGKTEIYLRAIGRALRQGRQALVLVPEIALTAQLVRRFAARFPGTLAVLHSGLSAGERYDEWRRLRSGQARLAIGSRSAIFAPLPDLALIILDEEHETSYKHDGAPRYHARTVALRLAALSGSVLILGSATPALESYHAALSGQLTLLRLSERVGPALDRHHLPHSRALPLPPVQLIDMRHELQDGNRSIFSRALQQAIGHALGKGEQSILFLNRRGAASSVVCRDCGQALICPNCSTPLTVHLDRAETEPGSAGAAESLLICHSCNHREWLPSNCPQCWSRRIKSFGIGTQRVDQEVTTLFPGARTLRWDRDSVHHKHDHTRMLDRFLDHQADVLIGTQMIAKGLDLPLVSVVGVVAADTGLHLPDFRAGERAFQLLTQVAGRAGRRAADARVVLQTYAPDHYVLQAAQEHDYQTFYSQEIAFRRQASYPPFSHLVRFVYSSSTDARSQHAAETLATTIHALASELDLPDWGLIGPAPAFFHRQRNRYRWHVILRAVNPAPLLAVLDLPHGWALDVDPVNML